MGIFCGGAYTVNSEQRMLISFAELPSCGVDESLSELYSQRRRVKCICRNVAFYGGGAESPSPLLSNC